MAIDNWSIKQRAHILNCRHESESRLEMAQSVTLKAHPHDSPPPEKSHWFQQRNTFFFIEQQTPLLHYAWGSFAFPGFDLPQIELQLLAFKHIAVCSATLAWSWGNTGKKLALLELLLQEPADLGILFPFVVFSFEFSLIVFCLKSLPPQESAWPPSCGPGAVHSGTRTTVGTVCCQ